MPRLVSPIAFLAAFLAFAPFRVCPASQDQPLTPEQVQFFESQVRPVLVEHCQGCHGEKKIKAGLRLDSRIAALSGGDTGPAVVPGKPEESPLVAAIKYEGPEMPPKGKLPQRQVEALTQWVKMGAPWPGGGNTAAGSAAEPAAGIRKPGYEVNDVDRSHWSFRPLKRPAVPQDVGSSGAIDYFIRAGLEAKGLTSNPHASKHELIRRVTYDLTGLPPTPAEVDAFEADSSPDAFARLIDRLLESPRYGEKWGRHWLDLVRFAETNSYERDGVKPNAWRYRDYVIRSFNQDKPYDRFIEEQLAGDELPDGGPDGLIATGYYRLGLWDDEPVDRDQSRYDGLDDIVATTGQVFLGLTVDCARCHDHKLDPIPQKDYYKFLAFFQNVNHYRNGGPTDEATFFADNEAKAAFEKSNAELTKKREGVLASVLEIEHEFRAGYEKLKQTKLEAADIEDLGFRFYRDTWDKLPDFDSLKAETTGQLPEGRFDLAPRSRNEAFGFVFEGNLVILKDGQYTFFLDSDDGSRLSIDDQTVIENDGIHTEGEEQSGKVELKFGRVPIRLDYFQRQEGLGLNVSWSGPGFDRRLLSSPKSGQSIKKPKELSKGDLYRQMRLLGASILGVEKNERYNDHCRELEELRKRKAPADRALVVTEAGPKSPDTHVMLRGNPHNEGDKVEPGFLQVVSNADPTLPSPPPGSKTTRRRTILANWIASPDNPLTARVMANRVWQYHFGRGIVRSSCNLGTQGDKPTHPELLVWLASELISNGWRLKSLHRLILNSDAYKMSSKPNPTALAVDPINDRFWRFDMRRLTAEEIRDSILAVSGTLNIKMYGPGVYPEIPDEVKAGQSIPGNGWSESSPEDQVRRSVYVHVKRSLVLPILESFDLAETDRSSPVRFSTTQPTQALGMLNGSFMNRQARLFAERLRREAGPDTILQVEHALRLATGRRPTENEVKRGLALITTLTKKDGATPELALESFCLVVLNLNEFLYLD